MISSPLLYLLLLAFIATSVNLIESRYNLKFLNTISAIFIVFVATTLLSLIGIFEFNEEIQKIYSKTKTNILPAMIFLFLLEFNLVSFIKNIKQRFFRDKNFSMEIGCACKMGAKRYWFLIAFALLISLLSQILANFIPIVDLTIATILIASSLGILGSFTKLKEMNGSSEVATTMLYLFVALLSSKVILFF